MTNWIESHSGSSGRGTPIAPAGPCEPVFDSPFFARDWMTLTCGLFRAAVHVGVLTEVRRSVVRLRVVELPRLDLVQIDEHLVAVDPRREPMQRLVVVVRRHTRLESIVPTVHTTDEVAARRRVRRRAARHGGGIARTARSGPSRDRPASPPRASIGPRRDQRSRPAPPPGCRGAVRTTRRCDAVARSGAFRLVHTRSTRGAIKVLDVEAQRRRRLLTPASRS